jgi:predicted GH43/DUF377 family glycosyl hydrolase
LFADVITLFAGRHKRLDEALLLNYQNSLAYITSTTPVSENRKKLIGAYFSKEYSIQSAALFNPSIVPHPDQSNIAVGSLRVIISLRATGEGHISSVVFREGLIGYDGSVVMEPDSPFATLSKSRTLLYAQRTDLPIEVVESNYDITFSPDDLLSERIIFPSGPTEGNGIEDARFVRFLDKDLVTYYGTYTAYDGYRIYSQLIETDDFLHFKVRTMNGSMVKDKGMALFPRKINGQFVMISRLDGENLYIMRSEDIYTWNSAELLRTPEMPWEFVQIGNCGSPIETDEGWLLITHAVGAFRRYVISAILLDRENPGKVIAYLPHPLIEPNNFEREGYVPNAVYSCGALVHNGTLILPYAKSDSISGIATIALQSLLSAMKKL